MSLQRHTTSLTLSSVSSSGGGYGRWNDAACHTKARAVCEVRTSRCVRQLQILVCETTFAKCGEDDAPLPVCGSYCERALVAPGGGCGDLLAIFRDRGLEMPICDHDHALLGGSTVGADNDDVASWGVYSHFLSARVGQRRFPTTGACHDPCARKQVGERCGARAECESEICSVVSGLCTLTADPVPTEPPQSEVRIVVPPRASRIVGARDTRRVTRE